MSEISISWISFGNLIFLAFACLLYSLGGREGGPGKGARRFGSSAIIATAINITALLLHNWSAWLLAVLLMCIFTFIQGYGGHSLPKIAQRLLIVVTSILCGVLCAWVFNCWWLLIIHTLVAIGTILFAVKNPIQAAAEEEVVCFLLYGVCLFYPFVA